MKVLLLYPNRWGRGFTPIGLSMISAVLKERGHTTRLFDTTFYDAGFINEKTEGEKYLSYKPVDLSNYGVKFVKRNEIEDLKQLVSEYNPELIVFSIYSSHLHSEGEYNMYNHGKELILQAGIRKIPVVVGGIIPTVIPDRVLDYGVTDIICRGECEEAIGELVDKMDKGQDITKIKNIWVKKGKKIYKNDVRPLIQYLDQLPFMDLSIFNDKNFYRPFKGNVYRTIDAELSRGCMFSCDYCVETVMQKLYGFRSNNSNSVIQGKGYHREKSVERILNEFKYLKNKFNIEFIRFQDSNFMGLKHDKLKELAERFPEEVGLPFYIEARPEGITKQNVKILKKMGCVGVGMGLEVGDMDFRKNVLNRTGKDDLIINACNYLCEEGLRATTYNIIGFPDETRENIMKTIELNRKANPESMTIGFYSPFMGTPMFEHSLNKNIIPNDIIKLDQKLYSQVRQDSLTVDELIGIRNTFIMYVLMSKVFWPIIRIAENNNVLGRIVYKVLRFILNKKCFEKVEK